MNVIILALVMVCVILNTAAQVLLKKTMMNFDNMSIIFRHFWQSAWQIALSPYFISGMACYVISLFVWLLVLSKLEVSVAYPMASLGYIGTALVGYWMFNDPMTASKIIGILVIIVGVYLVAR